MEKRILNERYVKRPRKDFRHLLLRKGVKKEKVKGASPMLSMGSEYGVK